MNRRVRSRPSGSGATRPTKRPETRAALARWARRLGLGLMIATLPLAVFKGWTWLDKPVAEVVLTGEFPPEASSEILGQLKPLPAGGVLSLDLESVAAPVESLDWVEQVRVKRHWPDRLTIQVQQHRAVARWNDSAYLNTAGEVVASWDEQPGLPRLYSTEAQADRILQHYLLLERALDPAGLQLVGASMDGNDNLSLSLVGSLQIELGNRDLLPRLQRVLAVWKSELSERAARVEVIDARYATGVAVRWKNTDSALAQR